jgi:hypothetical protein
LRAQEHANAHGRRDGEIDLAVAEEDQGARKACDRQDEVGGRGGRVHGKPQNDD